MTKMLLPSGEEGHSPNKNIGFLDTTYTTCNRSNQNAGFLDTQNGLANKHAGFPDTTKTPVTKAQHNADKQFLFF